MTLIQLRYLLAIADSGLNISLAAAKIHATQPALSRQIKQLEVELGVILFVRGVRSLNSITPVGEKIIAHARILQAEAILIRTIATQSRSAKPGQSPTPENGIQYREVMPMAAITLYSNKETVA
ncbi:MAG: LysR family transcriptional regulator [Arenimonas sp.]